MIMLDNVCFAYRGSKPVLNEVNTRFFSGDRVGIYAESGQGKTTLARLLNGFLTPSSGFVHCNGSVSWILGDTSFFHRELSVYDNLVLLCEILNRDLETVLLWVNTFAQLQDFQNKPLKGLTPQQKALLGYSISLAVKYNWYIADEKLTVGGRELLPICEAALEQQLSDSGLIFFSKNSKQLRTHCNRFFILKNTKLIECESAEMAEAISKQWPKKN